MSISASVGPACPQCGRVCASDFGLRSHLRVHQRPQWQYHYSTRLRRHRRTTTSKQASISASYICHRYDCSSDKLHGCSLIVKDRDSTFTKFGLWNSFLSFSFEMTESRNFRSVEVKNFSYKYPHWKGLSIVQQVVAIAQAVITKSQLLQLIDSYSKNNWARVFLYVSLVLTTNISCWINSCM